MSDLFNVFSKDNWCRFILSILLTWALTYTPVYDFLIDLLKRHLGIEEPKTIFFILLLLFYLVIYPVLDKFLKFNDSLCPLFEGTNPFESSMGGETQNEVEEVSDGDEGTDGAAAGTGNN